MERTHQEGKRIGWPKVIERSEFASRLAAVMERLTLGEISRNQAARELAIGYDTLKLILDHQRQMPSSILDESWLAAVIESNDGNTLAEVLY